MLFLLLIIFLFIFLLMLAELITTKKETVTMRKELQELKEIIKSNKGK